MNSMPKIFQCTRAPTWRRLSTEVHGPQFGPAGTVVSRWASAVALVLAALLGTGEARAQKGPYDGVNEVAALIKANQDASTARLAFENKDWRMALQLGTSSCDAGVAGGCAVLGRVLAEPRSGLLDLRAAEAAHRKAASLHVRECQGGSLNAAERCEDAASFFLDEAVPALRDANQAGRLFDRARDLHALSCERSARDCERAGELFANDRQRPDPVRAVQLWRRGCDGERPRENQDAWGGSPSCNRLIERLLDGGPDVRNLAEARQRLIDGNCSIAHPDRSKRKNRRLAECTRLAELLLDGQGGPVDARLGEQLLRYACARAHRAACDKLQARGWADDFRNALAVSELGFSLEARPLFERLCTANDARGCVEAGRLLRLSQSPADKERALVLLARACTLGNVNGCHQQALGLRTAGGAANLLIARDLLKGACEQNDAPSCRVLGFMHGAGEGGAVDAREASRLYELACSGRDGFACQNLGNRFRNGTGVAIDASRARTLYERACELGAPGGCTLLGEALVEGLGGPADPQRGLQLSRQSCDRNQAQACSNLASLLEKGAAGQPDPRAARSLFEKACNLRHAAGCVGWSDSLLADRGGPPNRERALEVRQFACLILNHAPACAWLEQGGHRKPVQEARILASNGRPVPAQVQPLLRSACNAGDAEGCMIQAMVLAQGNPASTEILGLFKRACTLGRQEACLVVQRLEGSLN